MKLLGIFKSSDNIQLDKKTLVALRWIAITGQLITISFVYFILNFNFLFFYCSIVIFFGILSNIFLQFREKKNLLSNFISFEYLLLLPISFSNSFETNFIVDKGVLNECTAAAA